MTEENDPRDETTEEQKATENPSESTEEAPQEPRRRRVRRRGGAADTTTMDAEGDFETLGPAVSRTPRFAEEGDGSRTILSHRDGDPDADAENYDEYNDDYDDEDESEEYTLRDRIGDRVYDAREWVSDRPRNLILAVLAILLSGLIFLGLGYLIFAGGDDPKPANQKPSGSEGNPGATPGDAQGLNKAENAGEAQVTIASDGGVSLVHAVGGSEQEWSGTVERRDPPDDVQASGDTAHLELSGPNQATFDSVLAENEARSWQGKLVQQTSDGTVIVATQTSDPGAAALDGRVPVVRGSYVAKGAAGAGFSANGEYTDTLVDESTIERIYKETYLNEQGEPESRSWRTEYNVSGDGALLPFLIGYDMLEAKDGE